MSPTFSSTLRTIIIAVVVAALSGVGATAFTAKYLMEYALDLDELTQPLRLTQERPRSVPQVYVDALREISQKALPVSVDVYGALVPANGFALSDRRGSGTVLTSDGWMLAGGVGVGAWVARGGESCQVETVVRDTLTGLSFARCDVNGWPVADLGKGYALIPGEQVFVVDGARRFFFTQVAGIRFGEGGAQSSDVPARRLELSRAFEVKPGSAVFSLAGALVGFIDPESDGSLVIPFEHLSGAFTSVLKNATQVERATLGVKSIDLALAVGIADEIKLGQGAGALVSSVVWGSPAYDAGIRAGDVIVSIDGLPIDVAGTLDDLLATYAPGSVVRLMVVRSGEKAEIEVTLGSSLE